MRILFLTQIIPYPPDSGPKTKTWYVLRYLAGLGHQVYLVSFMRSEEEAYVDRLREICTEVHTVPIYRSRVADLGYLLKSVLTRRPFLIERDDLPGMRRCIEELTSKIDFDCIHADQLTMTQFALPKPSIFRERRVNSRGEHPLPKPKRIFDAHNAVWTIVRRLGETLPWYVQPVIREEQRRVKRYEGMLVNEFDHTLAVTEIDRKLLIEAQHAYRNSRGQIREEDARFAVDPDSVKVIPIAVDTRELQPVQRQAGCCNILTLGTLRYPPNADGIRWFIQEIFPQVESQIPNAHLTIIGRDPPEDFVALASSQPEKFTVTGFAPDLVPYFEQAAVVVVPVRVGSGMRVRILDAFAHALPVVTTTVGLEGIDAVPGEDLLVADSPEDYANAVIQLIQDGALQDKISRNGRRLVETRYDWRVVLNELDAIYSNHGA